jgi:hypothetical protein
MICFYMDTGKNKFDARDVVNLCPFTLVRVEWSNESVEWSL